MSLAGEQKAIPHSLLGFLEGFWLFLAGKQKRIPTVLEDFWKDFEEFEAELL